MTGAGGYVVVLFGGPAEAWCPLARCPLGTAQWFPDQPAAATYASRVPAGFVPHLVAVVADAAPDQDHQAGPPTIGAGPWRLGRRRACLKAGDPP